MTNQEFQTALEKLISSAPEGIVAFIAVKNQEEITNVMVGSVIETSALITLVGFKNEAAGLCVKIANKGLKSNFLKSQIK